MGFNGKYSQSQIVEMLYSYLVARNSAADVCVRILGMTEKQVGSRKSAWRILEPYYRSYGFLKRYEALQRINKSKLASYVALYWNKNASEKDMLAYFPELAGDIAKEKQYDREHPSSWGSSSSSSSSRSNTSSEWKARSLREEPDTYQGFFRNDSAGNQRAQNQDSLFSRNPAAQNRNEREWKPASEWEAGELRQGNQSQRNRNSQSESDIGAGAGGIVGVIILIIIGYAIIKSGIIGAIFGGIFGFIGGLLRKLWWILELLCFYGGIVLAVLSLIRGTLREMWLRCLLLSIMGIGFGMWADGRFWVGLAIVGITGICFGTMAD